MQGGMFSFGINEKINEWMGCGLKHQSRKDAWDERVKLITSRRG